MNTVGTIVFLGIIGMVIFVPFVEFFLKAVTREADLGKNLNPIVFISKVNNYFSREKIFREGEISFHARSRLFFNRMLTSLKPVVVGRNGWLFLSHWGGVDSFSGQVFFSAKEQNIWLKRLGDKNAFLEKEGIGYAYFVVPDKQYVYPEFFSPLAGPPSGVSDGFNLEKILKSGSAVKYFYLLDDLLKAKKDHLVYFPNDTHWNLYGMKPYVDKVLELAGGFVSGPFPEWDALFFEDEMLRYSDLKNFLGMKDDSEIIPSYRPISACAEEVPYGALGDPRRQSLARRMKARIFSNKDGVGTLLIYGDSFSFPAKAKPHPDWAEFTDYPQLACFFKETYFIGTHFAYVGLQFLRDGVLMADPDFVVEEHVERNLKFGPDIRDKDIFGSPERNRNPLFPSRKILDPWR